MTGIHRQPVLIPDPILEVLEFAVLDLGSVIAPPPLEHRQSGVGWSKVFDS